MDNLGQRIKVERERLGLTQEELGRKCGMSDKGISDIERGRTRATTRVVSIAKALKVTPTWLETGRGPKDPPHSTTDPAYIAAHDLADLAQKLVDKGDEEIAALIQMILAIKGRK